MIIGIAGQLNSGKDELANYLVGRLNEPLRDKDTRFWVRRAFADAVKQVYEETFGVDRKFIEDWKRKPEPPPGMLMNVRKALQFIGDGFRQIKGDIWIEIALRDAARAVLSDSRYINEARAIWGAGGYMVVLWRPGYENDDPNPSEAQIRPIVDWCLRTNQDGPLHWNFDPETDPPPEGIQCYNYFLRNDGTLKDLHRKCDEFLLPILEKHHEVRLR